MTSSYSKTSVFWSVHNKTISQRFKRLCEPFFFGVQKRRLRVNGRLKRRKKLRFQKCRDTCGRKAPFYVGLSTQLSWIFATIKSLSYSSSYCKAINRQGSASKAGSLFKIIRETAVSVATVRKTANESALSFEMLNVWHVRLFLKIPWCYIDKKKIIIIIIIRRWWPFSGLWKHSITYGLTFNYLIRSTDSGACHICGELGHKRRDCPTRLSELPKKRYHCF